jgi:inosose dehydratase
VSDGDIERVADAAQRYATIGRELGLSLAWHQHWGGIFEWPEPFHRFMAATDPGLVNFCPDSAQLAMGGFDVVETFARYADRIKFVHFKDLAPNHDWALAATHGGPAQPGDSGGYHVDSKWRMVELGRGVIDFPALLAILAGAGYDGWIVDDMDYSAYAALECATVCRDYLRGALGLTGRRRKERTDDHRCPSAPRPVPGLRPEYRGGRSHGGARPERRRRGHRPALPGCARPRGGTQTASPPWRGSTPVASSGS